MVIPIKKLVPNAMVPKMMRFGDAGFDLYALSSCVIKPGSTVAISTGLAMAIPPGYVGLVWDRSGLVIKSSLKIMGGVIDSNYRGEVRVGLTNLSTSEYVISVGDRVAQMLIQKVEVADFLEVDTLNESDRGAGGFGSSGR